MSCVQHSSVVITGVNKKALYKAKSKAIDIFGKDIVTQTVKSDKYESFMIFPNGYKFGGNKEINYLNQMKELVKFLNDMVNENKNNLLKYVVVSYGDYGCKIDSTNQVNKVYL